MRSDEGILRFPDLKKTQPKVLAFDTSGPFVSVGWAANGHSGGMATDMARGQAEALFPMLEDLLASLQWTWAGLDAIGVGVGPGNFTGIRIAVSAARGLGLALGVPVFGISAFEAAFGTHGMDAATVVSLPAPRGLAYVQAFGPGKQPLWGPGRLIDPGEPPADMQLPLGMSVHGFQAERIASFFAAPGHIRAQQTDPGFMAEIAGLRYLEATEFPPAPAPLYVRPADAAPSREAPVVLLD